jgi:hypothetical protein
MKLCKLALAAALALPVAPADAFEFVEVEDGVRECYGRAMIGLDSVINARLGVPAEHALALARRSAATPVADAVYRDDVLIVIWDAYLWQHSPHSYAINVFYRCAREHDAITRAGLTQ